MLFSRSIRGFFDELTDKFGRRYGLQIEDIERSVEVEIDSSIKGLGSDQLDALITSIREQRKLVSTGAAYDNEIVSTSKQILTFGAAGIGLAAAFSRDLASLPPLFLKLVGIAALFYFNLILLSLYTLFSFLWQARFRYPFLYFSRIGNALPYFYYRAISPDTPRTIFQTAEEKMLSAKLYAKDLKSFVQYMVPPPVPVGQDASQETESLKADRKRRIARDDLQQYFLLLSYQGYVNQYEVRMNNQFLYGLIASAIATLVLAIYTFCYR